MKHYRPNFKPTEPPQPPPAAALPIPDGAERAEWRRPSQYFPVVAYYLYVFKVGKSGRGMWIRHGYTIEGKDVESLLLVGGNHADLVKRLEASANIGLVA